MCAKLREMLSGYSSKFLRYVDVNDNAVFREALTISVKILQVCASNLQKRSKSAAPSFHKHILLLD